MKIFRRIIYGILIAFFLSIVFSSIFPGSVRIVDKVRLFAQRPVIIWLGKIRMDDLPIVENPTSIADVDIEFEELKPYLENLSPGSIFLTRTRNYAISEFIPGMWKHAGIFLGTKKQLAEKFGKQSDLYKTLDTLMANNEIYVLDSEADGVRVHHFKNLSNMNEKSYLTNFVLLSMNASIEVKETFIMEALKFLGRDYDYDWLTEDDSSIYCSELLYHSLKSIGMEIKKRSTTLSRVVITPDDLFNYLIQNSGKREEFVLELNISKENGKLTPAQR
ncbi:MAG: YiiX/YebB-like N1pC/P60 family cysteine hydrolase [Bacteroidales bacterium]|nr:YiiX/YebB-like N1pC/P60 family cysteine hydrolase [Bacteroidales bacterium]